VKKIIGLILLFSPFIGFAQATKDTAQLVQLEDVTITTSRKTQQVNQLPNIYKTFIIAGKKSEIINVQDMPANLAEKTGRQLFAKIPGAFIYDMDGSGNQVNVSTRGLDAHRSWEFNIRQNGVLTNTDIYGYPASHYSMPMEAVKNIEIVRGTASLQYGAEFGGMINYVIKSADTTKRISYEGINTVGSYGLFSSYNALGGKVGKLTYYTYYQKRVSDGYRDNSSSVAEAMYASANYDFTKKLSIRAELGRSTYVYQLPGALTDSMFKADPRQSTRSRNYYSPNIYVPSITLNWNIDKNTVLNWVVSGVFGTRKSVQFEGFADKPDVIDPATGQYKPRVVDIDNYNSKTSELRLLHHYTLAGFKNVVTAGIRYFNNNLHRRQQGKGTTGTDFDMAITDPSFGRDLHYKSQSIAFSVENMINITSKFTVSPGFRYEYGKTDMTGSLSYLDPKDIPNTIQHKIPAFGVSTQYQINKNSRFYGGISQSYRPVILKDIVPNSTLEKANKNLKDAYGYTIEAGVNGRLKEWLKYDVTVFRIQYNNRLGNNIITENGVNYIYKTNIGDSKTDGVEAYVEATPVSTSKMMLSFFTGTSYMSATYQNAKVSAGAENKDVSGNIVESVPTWISRNGINFKYKIFAASLLYSYTGESFSDALNTVTPSTNGAIGLVPAYGIWDFNTTFHFQGKYVLRMGVNNIANLQYFTKRPLFYPGPGVWSSDGRSIVVSFGVKI
jgi:Fe(3+) dicitrate transport protein